MVLDTAAGPEPIPGERKTLETRLLSALYGPNIRETVPVLLDEKFAWTEHPELACLALAEASRRTAIPLRQIMADHAAPWCDRKAAAYCRRCPLTIARGALAAVASWLLLEPCGLWLLGLLA